jgi:hypothetical protein
MSPTAASEVDEEGSKKDDVSEAEEHVAVSL